MNDLAFWEQHFSGLSVEQICAFNRATQQLAQTHVHDAVRRGVPLATANADYDEAVRALSLDMRTSGRSLPVAAQAPPSREFRVIGSQRQMLERMNSMNTINTVPPPPDLAAAIRAHRKSPASEPAPEPPRACNLHGVPDPPSLVDAIRRRRQKEAR